VLSCFFDVMLLFLTFFSCVSRYCDSACTRFKWPSNTRFQYKPTTSLQ
jgi:hypothetical protein